MLSATTGKPKAEKRSGSPFALSTNASHWGRSRSITRASKVLPPISRSALSPPPMRRARPPARRTPTVGSLIVRCAFAAMLHRLFLDIGEVLVEDDALGPGESDEALAARPADQGEPGLARELDAPGGEA